jgi:hypothetical protein
MQRPIHAAIHGPAKAADSSTKSSTQPATEAAAHSTTEAAGKHLRRRGDSQHSNNRGTREKMIRLHVVSPDMPRPIRDLQEELRSALSKTSLPSKEIFVLLNPAGTANASR